MLQIIKWILFLIFFMLLGLTAYAYLGPFFGADFSAPLHDITIPVEIDAQ
jgi:hypothetical protein